MLDFALALLLGKVDGKLMVGGHHRPRLLNWLASHHRSEPKATAIKTCDPNLLKAIEVIELWELPSSSTGRPFERRSSTDFGNCISKFDKRLQEDFAMLPSCCNLSFESRTSLAQIELHVL